MGAITDVSKVRQCLSITYGDDKNRRLLNQNAYRKEIEARVSKILIERYGNSSIVAHVDHGKSRLSDRLLELTGLIQSGGKQVLDKLDVERERGITVKAQTVSMMYKYKGEDFLLHLVDTPGHVYFRAEASRSHVLRNGALLVVNAQHGIQAQTVAKFYLAYLMGLKLTSVISHQWPCRRRR